MTLQGNSQQYRREASRAAESVAAPGAHALEAALQAMSDGVMLFATSGRVVFVNDAQLAMWGHHDVAEMVTDLDHYTDVFELYELDGRPLPFEEWPFSRVRRGEQISGVELRALRKDTGRRLLCSFSGHTLTNEGGEQLALVVTRDLTENRRGVDALRESEGRFRDLADAMPQLVWMARADSTVVYCNSRAAEYANPVLAHDGTSKWQPVAHPDDLDRLVATWTQAVATGSPYVCEHRARMADGSFRWHLSRAVPVDGDHGTRLWYGTSTDIHEVKVSEAALRQSEEKYRALFESVDQGFCVIEIIFDEHGECVDYVYREMNRTFEEQSGLKDARDRSIRELVPDFEGPWFEIYGNVVKTGEPKRSEDHAPALGRWFDVYAFRLGAPEHNRVAVLFSNTTERKRREQNAAFLAELNADLALALTWDELIERVSAKLCAHLELSRVAFAEVDDDANEATVLYSRQSDASASALGTHSLPRFMDEDFLRQLKRGATVAIEDVAKDPRTALLSESYADFEVGAQVHVPYVRDGRLSSLLAIYREQPYSWQQDELDLMQEVAARLCARLERARAEEALHDRMERYRLLGRATNDVIWDWDPNSAKLEWNEALTEQYGHSLEQMGTALEGWVERLHPNDRDATVASLHHALDDGEESWTGEYRFARADGSYATVLDRGYILRDRSGRVVRMIGSMLDLTERKAAETALKEAAAQKDEWLAMLSHELRNPLAPIRNGVHILQRAAGGPQATRALEIIDRQAVHMTRLIDDLLDATRLSRGKVRLQRAPLELGPLVRQTVEDHRAGFASAGVTLDVELAREPLLVHGDRTRLAQVIGNLLLNAVKFTAKGGRASVHLTRGSDAHAVISVHDDGAGIAPHLQEDLFHPFMQADATLDRSRGGLGLGLTLVKGLIEMHGGTVSVESRGLGHGSTFTLRIPLAADAGASLPSSQQMASESARSLRVLLVDDQEDVVDSLRDVLELNGHTVATASDGEAAIDTARRFAPDVVLCDLGLPGMDGYAVARHVRQDPQLRESFLVALSGYARAQDVAAAHAAGFDRHLAKPPDLARLDALLSEVPARAGASSETF